MDIKLTLADIAERLKAKIIGDASVSISSLASLEKAVEGDLTFLGDDKRYHKHLEKTKASAVLLTENKVGDCPAVALVVENPQLAFSQVAALFKPKENFPSGVHPTAIVGDDCKIDASAHIGPFCVIADNVSIGANTVIEAHCVLKSRVTIGKDCHLYPRVTCYSDVVLANKNTIHSGAVIGADGFGLIDDNGKWAKVPQLGGVKTGDQVEIGANTTIDRGALEDTTIGTGVKIDNQVQIAHNVIVGDHTAIAGCVGIAGSTRIGKHCILGGGVAVNGHIDITDGVILAAMSAVSSSIKEPGVYAGQPSLPRQKWQRNIVHYRNLDNLVKRVRNLEKSNE